MTGVWSEVKTEADNIENVLTNRVFYVRLLIVYEEVILQISILRIVDVRIYDGKYWGSIFVCVGKGF